MANTSLPSVAAFRPVAAAFCGGRAPSPSPKPVRRTSPLSFKGLPDLSDLALFALPKVAHLADTPSLMALALIAEGVSALIPEGFRTHKEKLS